MIGNVLSNRRAELIMGLGRVAAVVAACIAVLVQGTAAQASSARRPVTMTLARPQGRLTLGDQVSFSGRASAATGNAGTVDFYYKAAAYTVFTRIGTAKSTAPDTSRSPGT